ncbi:hypothetical protein Aperf_G00000101666 [Anoplocephala perfoliata]
MEVDKTLYISNLPPDVTDVLIYELFLQAGPVESVTLKGGYGFVTFEDEESVLYSCALFEGVRLYNYELKIKPRQGSKYADTPIKQYPPYAFSPLPSSSLMSEHGQDRRYNHSRLGSKHMYHQPLQMTSMPNSYVCRSQGHPVQTFPHNGRPLLQTPPGYRRSYRDPVPSYDRRYCPY